MGAVARAAAWRARARRARSRVDALRLTKIVRMIGTGNPSTLDRDVLPRGDESFEGTGAHVPREYVGYGMVQAGSENEFRHARRQSAVVSALPVRENSGKIVERTARILGMKL